jgi:CheY-specific phosphatase CheX
MNKMKLEDAVMTATKKTFEEMVFVDVREKEPDVSIQHSRILYISYGEPESGEIVLFLTHGCVQMIAENIYGKEWETMNTNDIYDCLLELLNVLAGNFMRMFYEQLNHQSTSFPKVVMNISEVKNIEKYHTFCFDAEGEPFKVCLHLYREDTLHGKQN